MMALTLDKLKKAYNVLLQKWYSKDKAKQLLTNYVQKHNLSWQVRQLYTEYNKWKKVWTSVNSNIQPTTQTQQKQNTFNWAEIRFWGGTTPEYRDNRNQYVAEQMATSWMNYDKNKMFNHIKKLSGANDNAVWDTVNDIYKRYNTLKQTPTQTTQKTNENTKWEWIKYNIPKVETSTKTENKSNKDILNEAPAVESKIETPTNEVTPANVEGDMYKDRTNLVNEKIKVYTDLTNKLKNIYDNYYKKATADTQNLWNWLLNINKDIGGRIKNQEELINKTFDDMQNNLDTIAKDYKKVSAEQLSWQKAAAEKSLRWQLWWAAQTLIWNYVQKASQDMALKQAQLMSNLAKQSNALKQNYLTMKNAIMQQNNLNEAQKWEYLKFINSKIDALDNMNSQMNSQLTDKAYKPLKEEVALKDKISQTALMSRLQNKLKTIEYKWQENDPEWRKQTLQQIISSAGSKWVSIPDSILNEASNASNATEAVNILYQYVAKEVSEKQAQSTTSTSNNNTNKLLQTLQFLKNNWWQQTNTNITNKQSNTQQNNWIQDWTIVEKINWKYYKFHIEWNKWTDQYWNQYKVWRDRNWKIHLTPEKIIWVDNPQAINWKQMA